MPTRPRCERALFVLGDKHAGKTFQIRHMFKDKRLGRDGRVPATGAGVRGVVWLSNERLLYLRAQAPQESGEDVEKFFGKIEEAIGPSNPRWNIVCPMRIQAGRHVPGGLQLVQRFINRYSPERVRVAVLDPRQGGGQRLSTSIQGNLIDDIRKLTGCPIKEPVIVDARSTNGLLLSDYFDFT